MKEKGCEGGYNLWEKGREEGDEGKWMQEGHCG